jgi:hypothetical protein
MTERKYTREGDRIENAEDDEQLATVTSLVPFATVTGHHCRNGFLPEPDDQGRPVLCAICRPASAQRIRDQRRRWGA